MVSKKVIKMLQDQVAVELDSAAIYLAMATWSEASAFRGTAGFMYKQAHEERHHAEKIMKFLLELGEHARVPGVREPRAVYKNIEEIFEETVKHEKKVTASIHEIFAAATENNDYAVTSFLKWFIDEQVEEEASAQQALDIVRLAGKVSLYLADKEIGGMIAAK